MPLMSIEIKIEDDSSPDAIYSERVLIARKQFKLADSKNKSINKMNASFFVKETIRDFFQGKRGIKVNNFSEALKSVVEDQQKIQSILDRIKITLTEEKGEIDGRVD